MRTDFGSHVFFVQEIKSGDQDGGPNGLTLYCIGVVMDVDRNDPNYVFIMPTHWAKQTNPLEWQRIKDVHLYRCKRTDMTAVPLPTSPLPIEPVPE